MGNFGTIPEKMLLQEATLSMMKAFTMKTDIPNGKPPEEHRAIASGKLDNPSDVHRQRDSSRFDE